MYFHGPEWRARRDELTDEEYERWIASITQPRVAAGDGGLFGSNAPAMQAIANTGVVGGEEEQDDDDEVLAAQQPRLAATERTSPADEAASAPPAGLQVTRPNT